MYSPRAHADIIIMHVCSNWYRTAWCSSCLALQYFYALLALASFLGLIFSCYFFLLLSLFIHKNHKKDIVRQQRNKWAYS